MQLVETCLDEAATTNILDTNIESKTTEPPLVENSNSNAGESKSSKDLQIEGDLKTSTISGLELFGLSHSMGKLLEDTTIASNKSNNTVKDNVSIEKLILYQIEFYFSIYNLPIDRFLKSLVESNEKGFVPLETIYKFKKMHKFLPQVKEIPNILRSSKLVEVSEDGLQIHRRIPIKNMQDHLESTYKWRSLFFCGFDLDQDLESLHFDFIQMLLKTAEDELKLDITREAGDYIAGRVVPLMKWGTRAKEFKGTIKVVFMSNDISIKFFEFFKNKCIFNGKPITVQKRNMYDIDNYLSAKKLARVSGFPETVHKNSLAQFFEKLSSDISKIEFSHPEHGPIPFVVIRFKTDPDQFVKDVNSTLFNAEEFPPKISPHTKSLDENSQDFTIPPPFLLEASKVADFEFQFAKDFLIQKASRTKRKRIDNNSDSVWEEMNKRSQNRFLKAAKEFDHRDLDFL